MKKNILLFVLLMLTPYLLRSNDVLKQNIKADLISKMELKNEQMGRKFILAIPPNEAEQFESFYAFVEIYIASNKDASLNINILGNSVTEQLAAGEVLTINEDFGLTHDSAEVREVNTALNKTITIESDVPISVYVMSSKEATTDGYMAIPVERWGNEYIHCSYYDNFEADSNQFNSGFLVLGSVNNTQVNVQVKGVGSDSVATLKDRNESIGDMFSFVINEGEVYHVATDGLTRGVFDITGTNISSSNPIGLISYHQRTVIPIFATSNRDHLCEMLPPVNSLGTTFASIAVDREGSTKGDLFRIVAVEDNTNYTVKWYDFNTSILRGETFGTLNNSGDFDDISSVKVMDPDSSSVTGTSVFESDKPILLMQYTYSAAWDGSSFDPCMLVVSSVEQYVSYSVFQTSTNDSFLAHYINIIAEHDPNDVNMEDLASLSFDGSNIVNIAPDFLSNNIPGTHLYWIRFAVNPGAHEIKGNGIKFTAFEYGYTQIDNYGWPAAMSFRPLDVVDSVAPQLTVSMNPNNAAQWIIHVEELTNSGQNNGVRQEDSGIWNTPLTLIENEYGLISENVKEPEIDFIWQYGPHYDYNVYLEVEDLNKFAKAYFYVVDDYGNISIDSVSYEPSIIVLLNQQDSDFGEVTVNTSLSKELVFENQSDSDIMIESIMINGSNSFSLNTDDVPTQIATKEKVKLQVEYAPVSLEGTEHATLVIKTSIKTLSLELTGKANSNKESLEFENGDVLDFETVAINNNKTEMLKIRNTGNNNISILSINLKYNEMFSIDNSTIIDEIAAGESVSISISYSPTSKSSMDIDSLIITTDNSTYTYPIMGKADDGDYIMDDTGEFIKISPNPIQSEANITVNLPKASNLTARIYGMEGQLVATVFDGMCNKGEKSIKLDASNLASGSYSLVIELVNKKYASQIVIAK